MKPRTSRRQADATRKTHRRFIAFLANWRARNRKDNEGLAFENSILRTVVARMIAAYPAKAIAAIGLADCQKYTKGIA